MLALLVLLAAAGPALADDVQSTELGPVPEQVVVETFGLEDFDDDLAVIVGQHIKLRETILFHFAKVSIRQESFATLDRVADLLKSTPEIEGISIEGHTDAIGKAGFNRELSRARALAVVEYLVSRGVAAERLSSTGHGEVVPVASNQTRAGMQANRRVEFILRGSEAFETTTREPAVAGLVHLLGDGWLYTSPRERVPMHRWESLGQGAAIEADAGSWLSLRFQDLGRLAIAPQTRVKLVRLEWEPDSGVRRLGAKLVAGRLELADRPGSQAVVLTQEGSLRLDSALARIERRSGALTVALYDGSAAFEAGDVRATLTPGHAFRYDRQDGMVDLGALADPPRRLMPIAGELDAQSVLRWQTSGEDDETFVVELARDAQFVERLGEVEVSDPELALAGLDGLVAGDALYVRVRAVGAGGLPGLPGEVRGYVWR